MDPLIRFGVLQTLWRTFFFFLRGSGRDRFRLCLFCTSTIACTLIHDRSITFHMNSIIFFSYAISTSLLEAAMRRTMIISLPTDLFVFLFTSFHHFYQIVSPCTTQINHPHSAFLLFQRIYGEKIFTFFRWFLFHFVILESGPKSARGMFVQRFRWFQSGSGLSSDSSRGILNALMTTLMGIGKRNRWHTQRERKPSCASQII